MSEREIGTALIVGASRGLGLGLAEEYLGRKAEVVATVRGSGTPLHEIAGIAGPGLVIEQLDVTRPDEIAALRSRLAERRFDLLFVNAGVANGPAEEVTSTTDETFAHVMATNALAPLRVIAALSDLVHPDGTIAVMSSGLGSVANNESGGWEVYRASKAALNMLLRSHAARIRDGRTYLALAPGWVRTDMGGPNASLDVGTSVSGLADVIAANRGRGGVAYLDYRGQTLPW